MADWSNCDATVYQWIDLHQCHKLLDITHCFSGIVETSSSRDLYTVDALLKMEILRHAEFPILKYRLQV